VEKVRTGKCFPRGLLFYCDNDFRQGAVFSARHLMSKQKRGDLIFLNKKASDPDAFSKRNYN
jgi:hypothetical protein